MAAMQPENKIEYLTRTATELIYSAFREGEWFGQYDWNQKYLALKASHDRINAERDALLADLTIACGGAPNPCAVCGHYRADWPKPNCELIDLPCSWCWRGLQEGGSSCLASANAVSTSLVENQSEI